MLLLSLACTGSLTDFFGGDGSETTTDTGSIADTGDTETEDPDAQAEDDARVRAMTDLPEGDYPCQAPILVRIPYITDGDTVYVWPEDDSEGFKVRMIGIDTPEIAHEDGEVADCYGDEATAFTASQIQDQLAWLTFDAECLDYYDRVLAYIIRDEGEEGFFNRVLARQGYATQLTVQPNSSFADDFADDVAAAKEDNLGLWGACE